jgi:signal peptidase I
MFGSKPLKELKRQEKLLRSLKRRYHKRMPADDLEALDLVLERARQINSDRDESQAADALDALDKASEVHLNPHRNSALFETVESVGLAIVIALVLRAFVIEAFTIPSGSMIPTLAVGDFLFVNKLAYGTHVPFTEKTGFVWDQPERGDIIVFVYPCNPKQDYIKRVVAVEGDVVLPYGPGRGFISVNGEPVKERRLRDFDELLYLKGAEGGFNTCPIGV